MRWHYSKRLPTGKANCIGVWEEDKFIGAVIFSLGASPYLGKRWKLPQQSVCELTRVALTAHRAPVSRIIAIAVRLVRRRNPGLRLIASFADPLHGHHGGIYQACGWIYTGKTKVADAWEHRGKVLHIRAFSGHNFGRPRMKLPAGAKPIKVPAKHRYLLPLDPQTRALIEPARQPYPRAGGVEGSTAPNQGARGGSNPTLAHPEES